MNEQKFESLKNQMDPFQGLIENVLSDYEKLGDKKDRMKVIKIEGDIIFEIMPELEKRRERYEKQYANCQDRVDKATDSDSRDSALFYLEAARKDKEIIDQHIEKFQNILADLKE